MKPPRFDLQRTRFVVTTLAALAAGISTGYTMSALWPGLDLAVSVLAAVLVGCSLGLGLRRDRNVIRIGELRQQMEEQVKEQDEILKALGEKADLFAEDKAANAQAGSIYAQLYCAVETPEDPMTMNGQVKVSVMGKDECGHWHEVRKSGPLAFVLGEWAEQLRGEAMGEARNN